MSLLLGIGSIIYANEIIKPNLEALTEQGVEGVGMAERGLEVLTAHSDAIGTLNPPQSSTLATLQQLPSALEQSAYLSENAAEALSRSATTLREIENDLGIILPDDALGRNAEALSTSAQSLRGLAPMLYQLNQEIDSVATDLTRTSQQAEQVQEELQNADVTLERAQRRMERAREVLRSTNLPTEVTRFIGMVGGLFIVMGVVLLGMAGLWRRLALQPPRSSGPTGRANHDVPGADPH